MAARNLNKPQDNFSATDAARLSRRSVIKVGGVGLAAGVAGVALLSGCAPTVDLSTSATAGGVLTKLSNVPVGGSFNVDIEGNALVVNQPTAGVVTAFSAICTHQGCKVGGRDGVLQCPCHGSEFSITTGDPETGPATTPLTKIDVKIDGDNVVFA
jgi:Rieske Fe-S protein